MQTFTKMTVVGSAARDHGPVTPDDAEPLPADPDVARGPGETPTRGVDAPEARVEAGLTTEAPTPASVDPAFPSLHIRPTRGWLNDPNGLSYVDGVYHVFFQYNPHSARHDAIVWGHVSSPDLLHWQEEPVALTPRPGHADSYGCWSGSVTVDDDVPTAVYSGLVADGGVSSVMLAHSDRRMRDWVQEEEPVAEIPEDLDAVRDPFILHAFGHRWAVQGAGTAEGRAAVVVHSCDDLRDWEYRGVLLAADHPVAAADARAVIWECPQLFDVDGTWVLIVSPLVGEQGTRLSFDRVAWLAGDLRLDEGGLRFDPLTGGRFDVGPDLYAPQVLALPDRVLTFGWIWEDGRGLDEIDEAGWAGVLSFPRELRVHDGVLVSQPARELTSLRREVLHRAAVPETGVVVPARAFEMVVAPRPRPGTLEVRLSLLSSDEGSRPAAALAVPSGAGLRVLVDGSVIEAFVDGQPNRSSRAYPTVHDVWTVDVLDAGAPEDVTIWRLGLPE
jgi:beta-fructofuranosidase